MPLYHSSAAILGVCAALSGGKTIAIGHKFSTKTFWKDVRDCKATMIQYVGETCRYLLAAPPEIDPATGEVLDKKQNVRLAFGNGLRPDVWNKFKERFDIEIIAEFYAATEGTAGSWNLSKNDYSRGAIGRNGTVAKALLGTQLAIVEVDWESEQPWRDPKTGFCKKVATGEPGELLYKLDANDIGAKFQGYFGNEKASNGKIMRNVLSKGDAFFRTGDVVRWDSEGRWFFNDRIGDTFRWKSENVSTSVSSPSSSFIPRAPLTCNRRSPNPSAFTRPSTKPTSTAWPSLTTTAVPAWPPSYSRTSPARNSWRRSRNMPSSGSRALRCRSS